MLSGEECKKVLEELVSRVEMYTRMVEQALLQVEKENQVEKLEPSEKELIELAKTYLEDTKYYKSKGDSITALSTISYAEGLLDSLARLGKISIEWRREKRRRVVTAGTFDVLHPGHVMMLWKAASLGDLYVIVARDDNVRRFKKRDPVFPEGARVVLVESLKPVRKAVLGDKDDILKKIIELNPDVVFLGPDQHVDESFLKKQLEARGLKGVEIVRLKERIREYSPSSSTQAIMSIIKTYCYQEGGTRGAGLEGD